MSAQENQANLSKVLTVLQEWDRGDGRVRCRILKTFVAEHRGKTSYELEQEFALVSSLFLARLTTWMRLTYMSGTILGLQLEAIGIFLSAQDQYLVEFLEDKGILALLDIVQRSQSREADKAEALHLLLTISNSGSMYKEIICENQGVEVSADCLTESNTDITHERACALLESLYHGNPKYHEQVYRRLIGIVDRTSPIAQQCVLHTLHTVQHTLDTFPQCIAEPLLNVLKTQHPEVQDEAIKVMLELLRYGDVRLKLLTGLVALLTPEKEALRRQDTTDEAEIIVAAPPVFVQQAAAAKAIRLLAEKDQNVSKECISLGVIQNLLHAVGNREHTDAQIQAGVALEHFVRSFPHVEEHVQRVMGSALFAAFMKQPDTLYMTMDETQAEVLLFNKIHVTQS